VLSLLSLHLQIQDPVYDGSRPISEERRRLLPYLHAAIGFLSPEMERIQAELRGKDFSENIQIFTELRSKVDESLLKPWTEVRVTPYLNADEQKEFRVEF